MRATILVERLSTSCGSYLVGEEVTMILDAIVGISDVRIDKQYIDGASLSYEANDLRQSFDQIDHLLMSRGMHRI